MLLSLRDGLRPSVQRIFTGGAVFSFAFPASAVLSQLLVRLVYASEAAMADWTVCASGMGGK